MATSDHISVGQVTFALNETHIDPKAALRIAQSDIKELLAELADPTRPLIIDGVYFWGENKFRSDAILLLNNKMETLQNQTTSIMSVFSELYRLERQLGGSQ